MNAFKCFQEFVLDDEQLTQLRGGSAIGPPPWDDPDDDDD